MTGNPSRIVRTFTAALLYFASVFGIAFILGSIRTLAIEPRLGPTAAVACEAPLLLLAMWLAARHVPDWLGFAPTAMTMISIGSIAIALIGAVDFLVGTQLRGMTGSDQVAYLATPAGLLYSALLVVFAFMPALANWPRHAT